MTDARKHAPAVARNREPLLEVLRRVLPARGRLLEIAAGSGEHAVFFARALPGLAWQPTDRDPEALPSIAAWAAAEPSPNLLPPAVLDVTARPWPFRELDVVLCVNMIHASPWAATVGLVGGAAEAMVPGGVLVTYGPYRIAGEHTAPSNAEFDQWLKARDPSWGVRDLEAVQALATAAGFGAAERVPMPANNLVLVFPLTHARARAAHSAAAVTAGR